MKSKRPTQADVARRAGVSRGTVSLVLNQTEYRVPISPETRERVVAAAQELGYMPNPVAQMLVRGTTRILGFYSFEETFPYSSEDFYYPYLMGIEREATNQDYNVLLFTRKLAELTQNGYSDGMSSFRLADGSILVGNYPNPVIFEALLKEGVPLVLIGRSSFPTNVVDTIVNDHRPCSYAATRHLIDLGHRQLGFIVDDLNLAYHQERLFGVRKAIDEAAGAQLTILSREELSSPENFRQALRRNEISALLCADRKLFTPMIEVLQKLALRIPQDLSLVFLVINTWNIPFTNPTHVKLNRNIKGKVAVERLVQRIAGTLEEHEQIQVPCEFVVGNTTAACLT